MPVVTRADADLPSPVVPWEGQTMSFNFNFSMPIQDTFAFTRDPNRFPAIQSVYTDSTGTSSPPDPPRPNRLATAHVDVQNYIMTFLSAGDLSALMKTCRYFLDACLLPLCALSNKLRFDTHLTRLPSFRRFLRINAGPSSRAHLIKELSIYASSALELRYIHNPTDIRIRKEWSAALLDILRHCRNMRRLRMYKWFLHDISFPLFVNTISSLLPNLEELMMPVPYGTDASVLRKLARLPLRSFSLTFFKRHPNQHLPDTYISLDVLPRSLTELDIHRTPRTDTPFLAVQRLGIRLGIQDTLSTTFVADATAAFPNVSHLVLRQQYIDSTRQVPHNMRLLDEARTRNKTQWESQWHKAWPSVSAIWAEDPSLLYILGFSRRVISVSLPIGKLGYEDYIAPILADTSPSLLELRIDMDGFRYRQKDWEHVFRPSIRRLTLLLYTRAPTDKHRVGYVLECFGTMLLPALPSLTHVLVRFMPPPQHPALGMCWTYYPSSSSSSSSSKSTQIVHGTIQKHLRGWAGTAAGATALALRWIGYEVFGWGIKSWDISNAISRPTTGSGAGSTSSGSRGAELELELEDAARRVKGHVKVTTVTEMGEEESMAVARTQGMDVFMGVRPTLVLTY